MLGARVPETSVNKDSQPNLTKNKIGISECTRMTPPAYNLISFEEANKC